MKAEKGSIRAQLARLLIVCCVLGYVGFVYAQTAMDPCAIYPKQSARIGQGTATQVLISGVAGKQIYICSIEVAQNQATTGAGATPALTLSYGVQVASTPCATGSPYAGAAGIGTLGVYGASGQTFIGGNYMVAGPVPAAAASPMVDVCGLVGAGNGIISGTVTYVSVP